MDAVNAKIAEFIRILKVRPFPPGTPTRLVMLALREHLDATLPDWRVRAFAAAADSDTLITVEFHLTGGQAVKGALLQRPSFVAV